MVKQNKKTQIKELLVKLEKSNDPIAKRKIRSSLRKLGHKGGLNHPKKTKKVKVTKVKKVKKVKKAA